MHVLLDHGMGDALSARAFIITYCKQKNVRPASITIYTNRHRDIFENDGFMIREERFAPRYLTWYDSFGKFPFRKVHNDQIHRAECISKNLGVHFNWQQVVPLKWNCPDISYLSLPERFVTINYGYDAISDQNSVCAKMWPIEYWEELVTKIGIPCIQIGGGRNTKSINGVASSFLNELSIKESAEVMKKALFHIDTEGGLTILNHHLGGKTVVLFGPTAIETFGFNENLNISHNTCTNSPCDPREINGGNVGIYQDRNHPQCDMRCMKELTPDYVIEQIKSAGWL